MRKCRVCDLEKPLSSFTYRNDSGSVRTDCKACETNRGRRIKAANPEKYQNTYRDWYQANLCRTILRNARTRARISGLAFNLTLEDIEIPDTCPLLGTPVHYTRGCGRGPRPGSPSIDRIDPSLGYVKGNVWIISHRANKIKNDATLDELRRIVAALADRMSEVSDV